MIAPIIQPAASVKSYWVPGLFALLSAVFCILLGGVWLPLPSGTQEIGYYFGSINSFSRLLEADGRLSWWNPDSMGGYSLAGVLSYAGAIPVYWILGQFFGGVEGFKVGALLYWWTGGLAAYALGASVGKSRWVGVAVGSFYLLSAQVLLRLAFVEHLTIVACFPWVPLAFLGLWRSGRRGAPLDYLLLAVAFALAWGSASKIGATLAVGLAAVGLGLFLVYPEQRGNLWRGAMVGGVVVLWLGILPLLPLVREFGFMTVFSLAPFAEWQMIFSQPAIVAGLDRNAELLAGLPPALQVARGGYYLTGLGVAALAAVLWWNWREERSPREWLAALRIFAGAALVLQWLSHGPRSVLGGQLFLLQHAEGIRDFVVVLVWLSFLGAILLLWWLVAGAKGAGCATQRHSWVFAGLLLIYLVVPGFRLVEFLPPFASLRAPDSFWILAGTMCWSMAAGLAVVCGLAALPKLRWRIGGGVAAAILLLADASGGFLDFVEERMPRAVMEEFDQAMEVLARQTEAGYVLPLSGRYFYMQVPWKGGQPLWTEAGHSNFMLQGMAKFQALGGADPVLQRDMLRIGAVRYFLVDRHDPDLDQALAERLQKTSDILYQGNEILLLRNLRALPRAYRADKFLRGGNSLAEMAHALALTEFSVATVMESGVESEVGKAEVPVEERGEFFPLAGEEVDSGRWRITSDGAEGLVVLTVAWHPDWRVRVDGTEAEVRQVWGALLGVEVPQGAQNVEFYFAPPAWYGAGLWAGGAGWALLFVGLLSWPWWPGSWKDFMGRSRELKIREAADGDPGERVAILIPTHNEISTIERLIREIFQLFPEASILVVDDISTDGTREKIRELQQDNNRLHLIERPLKAGLGSAYREAMAWALPRDFQGIVTMDGDGSHHPEDARALWEAVRAGAAGAVGSRYLPGSRVEHWPKFRLGLSRAATWYVQAWTGLPLSDATSGLKALRVDVLREVAPETLEAEGYAFQIELHFRIWRAGFVLVERAITFTEREGGCSKMNPGIVREAVWRVPGLIWKR